MFRLRTFGTASLDRNGVPLAGRATQRRRLALLALLAAARDRGNGGGGAVARDKLVAYLWPDRDAERGRHVLSQTLYELRREMGEDAFHVGVDDVRLNAAIVTSDVGEFDAAIAAGDPQRAIALYQGPFLDGFFVTDAAEFERWVEDERSRRAQAYGEALQVLARGAAARGDLSQAASWWRRASDHDRLSSRVALEYLQALVALGDRAGALQHARIHAAVLEQDLGVAPEPAVQSLVDRVREELRMSAPAAAGPVAASATPADAAARPLSAGSGSADTIAAPASALPPGAATVRRGRGTARGWLTAGAAVLAALFVMSTIALARRPAPPARAARGVVVGAIRGPDSSLGLAVREALTAELAAAPDVKVIGDLHVQSTLRLMERPATTELAAPVAVEVAQRQGASFAVVGSVTPMGAGAQIFVQLLDASSGAAVSTLTERPAASADVIPAVTRLARSLRERAVGAPLTDSAGALPAVTTASIDALRDYALARAALTRFDRSRAAEYCEAALLHDSLFVLAHYLAGDLYWYLDQQRRSDAHLTRAEELSNRLPPRERLIVRARYEQLVRDRLDSALYYWRLLGTSTPDEPHAYEGMAWVYLSLGDYTAAAAAADTALRLDPQAVAPNQFNRLHALLSLSDTAGAMAFAKAVGSPSFEQQTRVVALFLRRDWDGASALLHWTPPDGLERNSGEAAAWQALQLATGHLADAERAMAVTVRGGQQHPPRALLQQALGEVTMGGSREHGLALAREAFDWVRRADLSAPANGRLMERVADVAGRARDTLMLSSVRHFLVARDAGRSLRSYRLALMATDAYRAFATGQMKRAATLARAARDSSYFGRLGWDLVLLEADARAAAGERAAADSLYRLVANAPVGYDPESVLLIRALADRALARRGASGG